MPQPVQHSNVFYIALKLYIFLLLCVSSGNQTYDLAANTVLYANTMQ